ncbi:MAG: hypothetical protein LQ349_009305 [Xanthoria aureola]|nr:MAG: hypothetical protein LQ349_009305 [Xanthoria aureola]
MDHLDSPALYALKGGGGGGGETESCGAHLVSSSLELSHKLVNPTNFQDEEKVLSFRQKTRGKENNAQDIRRIKSVATFPQFLQKMGIMTMLGKTQSTTSLRQTVQKSQDLGYSRMPMSQKVAFTLRRIKEPGVEILQDYRYLIQNDRKLPGGLSFFPKHNHGKGQKDSRGGN